MRKAFLSIGFCILIQVSTSFAQPTKQLINQPFKKPLFTAPVPTINPRIFVKPKITVPDAIFGFDYDAMDSTDRAAAAKAYVDHQQEIESTLIVKERCRSLASMGYVNGYACPEHIPRDMCLRGMISPNECIAGRNSVCMRMLKEGKVWACAMLPTKSYGSHCNVDKEKTSPQERAASKCVDLSRTFWSTLALRASYSTVQKQLKMFGCKEEPNQIFFCPSYLREWICLPYVQGGVIKSCRLPKKEKVCSGGEFPTCREEER